VETSSAGISVGLALSAIEVLGCSHPPGVGVSCACTAATATKAGTSSKTTAKNTTTNFFLIFLLPPIFFIYKNKMFVANIKTMRFYKMQKIKNF
jgi:hypothetical protein